MTVKGNTETLPKKVRFEISDTRGIQLEQMNKPPFWL